MAETSPWQEHVDGYSTVLEIGGGPMVVLIDGKEVEVDVDGAEMLTSGDPIFGGRRLEDSVKIQLHGSTPARKLEGCLGCSCGSCD